MAQKVISIEKSKMVLKGYRRLQEDLEEIFTNSGFKISHIIEKSGLTRSTFYRKKKNLTFTVNELSKIIEICDKSA